MSWLATAQSRPPRLATDLERGVAGIGPIAALGVTGAAVQLAAHLTFAAVAIPVAVVSPSTAFSFDVAADSPIPICLGPDLMFVVE